MRNKEREIERNVRIKNLGKVKWEREQKQQKRVENITTQERKEKFKNKDIEKIPKKSLKSIRVLTLNTTSVNID